MFPVVTVFLFRDTILLYRQDFLAKLHFFLNTEGIIKSAMWPENPEYRVLDLHLPLGISTVSSPASDSTPNNKM